VDCVLVTLIDDNYYDDYDLSSILFLLLLSSKGDFGKYHWQNYVDIIILLYLHSILTGGYGIIIFQITVCDCVIYNFLWK